MLTLGRATTPARAVTESWAWTRSSAASPGRPSWSNVERRRRLRLSIVVAPTGYIGLTALANLLGAQRAAPVVVSVVETCGLAFTASAVAWSLLRVAGEDSLFPPTAGEAVSVTVPVSARLARLAPADQSLIAALEQAMIVERVYRQDGLTIGRLALRHGVPEYRLRRLINQRLGYRNFNSFLNRYRIAEAKAAFADPGQAAVPIVTIVLDAGFRSLNPFNRAFKAETGLTPSDYRRATGGGSATAPADSEIGQRVSALASHPSSSARKTTARASKLGGRGSEPAPY